LTLSSYYLPSLTSFSQWFLAITPLAVAFATFYLSVSISRDRKSREIAALVYTPLLKEVTSWLNPRFQMFGEWGQIKTQQPYWVLRMPKEITTLLEQAYSLYPGLTLKREIFYRLISQTTEGLSSEMLPNAGFSPNESSAAIHFGIVAEGYGEEQIVPAAIWETNQAGLILSSNNKHVIPKK